MASPTETLIPVWQHSYWCFFQAQTATCSFSANTKCCPQKCSIPHRMVVEVPLKEQRFEKQQGCRVVACPRSVAFLTVIWFQFCSFGQDCCGNPNEISGYNPWGSKIGKREQSRAHLPGCCTTGLRVIQVSWGKKKGGKKKVQSDKLGVKCYGVQSRRQPSSVFVL